MIVRMSRYDFVLYAAQSDDFVERLRELGLVDITIRDWEPSEEDRDLILEIEGHQKARTFLEDFRSDELRFKAHAAAYGSAQEAYSKYVSIQRELAGYNAELSRLEKSADELRPWGEFSVERLAELAKGGTQIRYFMAMSAVFEENVAAWSEDYTLEIVNRNDAFVWFVIITTPDAEVMIDAQEMRTPTMDIRGVEALMSDLHAKIEAMDEPLSRVAASEHLLDQGEIALKERLQRVKVVSTAESAAEGSLMVMEAWAARETSHEVDRLLDNFSGVVYIKSEPTPEDDTPVQLKNNAIVRAFELIGDMYARPKYGTIDLTLFYAPFYALFFAICLNDAGYGLVLALMSVVLRMKSPKPGMMRNASLLGMLCGGMSVLFGLLTGSFFGLDLAKSFPSIPFVNFQEQFLTLSFAIGMVQIILGMVLRVALISARVGFKYSLGALGWLIIVASVTMAMGLPMLGENLSIPFYTPDSIAFYSTLGLGGALMLLFNSPGKGLLTNLGAGLWEGYNNITGILGDVLSYVRLFAIGLAGSILALVFNSLAVGFVPDEANIVVRILIMLPILLIGHGINLFSSTISSFVHPMRLTFVEFYKNAGFEMTNRNFEPIKKMEIEK